MTENEQKIEQCKKDIEAINKNLVELEAEKVKETKLVPGDIAIGNCGKIRLIVRAGLSMISVNIKGEWENDEVHFESQRYRKVGRISDFIKEER